jgi:hypothetical protein
MGWTYGPKPTDLRKFFAGLYNYEMGSSSQQVLDVAVVNMKESTLVAHTLPYSVY